MSSPPEEAFPPLKSEEGELFGLDLIFATVVGGEDYVSLTV
jgi:hypothetical protein